MPAYYADLDDEGVAAGARARYGHCIPSFVVITGEIGSGKTTLLQSFLEELGEDIVFAVVSQTQLAMG